MFNQELNEKMTKVTLKTGSLEVSVHASFSAPIVYISFFFFFPALIVASFLVQDLQEFGIYLSKR